jgi:hypothetical protein
VRRERAVRRTALAVAVVVTAAALAAAACSGGQRGAGPAVPAEVELEWPDAAVAEPLRLPPDAGPDR